MKIPDTATFTDAKGRQWLVKLNVNKLEHVRETTGIKLEALALDQFKPLAELLSDYVVFVHVLWQLEGRLVNGLTKEDFAAGFDGDILTEAAAAFVRALSNFIPKDQGKILIALANKGSLIQNQAVTMTLEAIERIDPSTFWPSATKSAASSESIPVLSVSAN